MTFGEVMQLIAFVSVVLLIAGYIRATLLLSAIGLNAAHLLTATDYLSASASSFWLLVLSSGITVGFFLLAVADASRMSNDQRQQMRAGAGRKVLFVGFSYLVLVLFLLGFLYVYKGFASLIAWGAVCLLPVVVAFVTPLFRPMHRSPKAEALIMLLLTTMASVVATTLVAVESLRNGEPIMGSNVQIALREAASKQISIGRDTQLVMVGSNFAVLWDNTTRRPFAIPRDAIEYITSRSRP
jgi:hypothetical protein